MAPAAAMMMSITPFTIRSMRTFASPTSDRAAILMTLVRPLTKTSKSSFDKSAFAS